MTRRDLLATLASTALLPLLPACSGGRSSADASHTQASMPDTNALATLDDVGGRLLGLFPESATALGVDTGARAEFRSQLSDRSAAGRDHVATRLRTDRARVNAIDAKPLSHGTRTSVEAVRVLSKELRMEVKPYGIRTTIISPGAVQSELPQSITEPDIAKGIEDFYAKNAIPAESFARMVAFAMSQPDDVDVNEILFRPTTQEL